ncbi:hypothetical protein HNQ61_004244 [Longimicrobium terrae]|uniref:YcxB-like C-terminal domain-containing protein n=2 Tax=Longimicrobium terrae TaxID=1639882 RepID=A0A841H3A2_9BACT|nr:hypothetical protein [Longimicrobium terrae]
MTEAIVSQPLEFRFTWDRGEVVRAVRAVRANVSGRPWWLVFAYPVLLIMIVAVASTLWDGTLSRGALVQAIGPWILFLVAWATLMAWIGPWLTARAQSRENGPGQHTLIGTLSGDGYGTDNGRTQNSIHWNGVLRAVETPEFFLFYYNRNCAFYLPHRAIAPEQLPEVRRVIVSQLGDRAALRHT